MSIAIKGIGAVSAAGWGVEALRAAVTKGVPLPATLLHREGTPTPIEQRPVPKPETKLPFARHPRIRRSSPIARYSVAAALEAVGEGRAAQAASGELRIGVVFTSMNGSVCYSNRFYGEVLNDPSLASPILFPETVFNASSSHISAVFGSAAPNYSLPGDSANFLPAIEMGVRWLLNGQVDGCVVVGSEELDWLSSEAAHLFERETITSEGAGALYLEKSDSGIAEVECVTDAVTSPALAGRVAASRKIRDSLPKPSESDCVIAFRHDRSLPVQSVVGEAMGAGLPLEIVNALADPKNADSGRIIVNAVGHSQQCVGCSLVRI